MIRLTQNKRCCIIPVSPHQLLLSELRDLIDEIEALPPLDESFLNSVEEAANTAHNEEIYYNWQVVMPAAEVGAGEKKTTSTNQAPNTNKAEKKN